MDRLKKIREENPQFDKKMVDIFAKRMPELLLVMIDGEEYENHIGTKEVAMLAEPYIKDHKGNPIGFHWDYDTVVNTAKNLINLDEMEFYEGDIFVWANVKYGDMGHLVGDSTTILKYAMSELTDPDFPYYDSSKRAYCWLKSHIQNSERE